MTQMKAEVNPVLSHTKHSCTEPDDCTAALLKHHISFPEHMGEDRNVNSAGEGRGVLIVSGSLPFNCTFKFCFLTCILDVDQN